VVSSTEIDLSWNAPAGGASEYDVYEGTSSGGEPLNDPAAIVTGTTADMTGLTPGTTYYFDVTANTGFQESAASQEAIATTPFDPPTGLTAAVNGPAISLSWTAPADSVTPDHYNVYEGTSPGGEAPSAALSVTGTTADMTGLTPGTTYYFDVTAAGPADADGESAPSAEASAMAPCSPTTPDPPAGLTAAVNGPAISLSWDPPPSGSPPFSYNVYEGTSSAAESADPATNVTGTTASMTGLTAGTTYYFVVSAIDACGTESDLSSETSAVPARSSGGNASQGPTGPRGPRGPSGGGGSVLPTGSGNTAGTQHHIGTSPVVGAPLKLTVTSVGGSTAELSWTRPNGHSLVAGYNVYAGTTPGGENTATPVNPVMITQTTYTVTGLAPDKAYYFRVTTVDDAQQESGLSNEADATTTSSASAAGQPWLSISIWGVGPVALAIGGALLAVLAVRLRARRAARRGPSAKAAEVRAVPDPGPSASVYIHTDDPDAGSGRAPAVRFVPSPGTASVTIERTPPP
jgi:fibronectin type 3 domain-containing protein